MARGSKPGERRGGRKPGSTNKVTQAKAEGIDVKALAGQYTEKALAELGRLATSATSETARVSAIKELLDRGHGKPSQPVEATGRIEVVIVDPTRNDTNVDA